MIWLLLYVQSWIENPENLPKSVLFAILKNSPLVAGVLNVGMWSEGFDGAH